MSVKPQFCDWCGEAMGEFAYVRRSDGPLSCGALECERYARDAERGEREEAMLQAQDDDYGRYR